MSSFAENIPRPHSCPTANVETQSKVVHFTGGYTQPQVKPFLESRWQDTSSAQILLSLGLCIWGWEEPKIRLKSQSKCKSNPGAISYCATGCFFGLRQVSLCASSAKVKHSPCGGRPETQTSSSKWLEITRRPGRIKSKPGIYIFPVLCRERTRTHHTILAILCLSLGSVRPKYPDGIKPSVLQTCLFLTKLWCERTRWKKKTRPQLNKVPRTDFRMNSFKKPFPGDLLTLGVYPFTTENRAAQKTNFLSSTLRIFPVLPHFFTVLFW